VSQVNRATGETLRQQATQEGLVPLKAWVKNALDQVICVCMNEPGLEFVWVGDDAIDPLEQAQTLQILVGAGIKTREEARADLGLAPAGGAPGKPQAGLGKLNPHHDERGQFATADNAAGPVGSPTRKPRRTPVQVASNDAMMSDAIVDGGTADEAAVAQTSPGAGADGTPTASAQSATENTGPEDGTSQSPVQQAQSQRMPIIHDVPDDAISLTAGDGESFYAPPYADFLKVYAAGEANWQNPFAAISGIWLNGTYDFQRDNGSFYSAYTNASNYAVGVYMAGAGYSRTTQPFLLVPSWQIHIPQILTGRPSKLGGHGVGMTPQTALDYFRRSTIEIGRLWIASAGQRTLSFGS
jgi:hypothetical protein